MPESTDLLDWLHHAARLLPDGDLILREENRAPFLTLFGACAQTLRYGEVYASLWQAGSSREAVPIARAALEHAITAQWAFHTEGGIDRFQAAARKSAKAFYVGMADYLGNADLRETALTALQETRSGLPKWSEIMREIGDFVSSSYRQMSQITHVTGSTVAAFVENRGGRYEFHGAPEDPHAQVNLYVTANAVMLSAWVIGQLVQSPDLRAELDDISERLKLVQSIREETA